MSIDRNPADLTPAEVAVGNCASSASRVETAFASLRSESSRTAAALSAGGSRLLSRSQESVEVFPLGGGDRLVRQLSLCARARDQGESGWGVAIAHLDNVAERLVRAAYLVCEGGSESIKEEIRNDPGEPDCGRLIGAPSSVGKLKGIQDDCSVLHDIRSKNSEVPHPGETTIAADDGNCMTFSGPSRTSWNRRGLRRNRANLGLLPRLSSTPWKEER